MATGAALRGAALRGAAAAVVLFLVLPLVLCDGDAPRKCGPHLTTPGFTVPKGDIVIHEGTPLEILCVLTAPYQQNRYHNATDLRFYHNDTLVDPKYVEVLNETTLRYYMDEAPAMKAMFYCRLQLRTTNSEQKSVCLNTVFVGYEPLGVDNFNCVSYNWLRLNCSWVPKYNPVPTTYQIFFQLRSDHQAAYKCPNNSDQNENTCLWTELSDPAYRQTYPIYKMTLAGKNPLRNKTFVFEMDHFKQIIPVAPSNLEVVNMTSSSFFLKWSVPYPMNIWARSYKLIHKVAYTTPGGRESTENADRFKVAFVGTPNCIIDQPTIDYCCYFNLTGLDYAYYLYDVRVTIKTENATDAFWSAPASQVRKTAPSIPPMPPNTDVGSFEVAYKVPLRDVTIYWKSLPEYLHSGANFSYRVVDVLKNNTNALSIKIDFLGKKSAVLRNIGMHDTLVVRIASSNEVGDSKRTSVITIPGFNPNAAPLEPESFTKTSLRNGDFKLTWKSPKGSAHLVDNYTIFWCDSQNDRPETCTGYLDWMHVKGDAREVTVRLKPIMYHFAISANTEERSSGMVWASCSMVADKVDKLKTVYVDRFDATSMDVEWKLDCTDANNVVKGFIIFYCVANDGMDQGCKDAEQNLTIVGDHSKRSAKLSDLQPYVTYRVTVAIKTEVGRSLPSNPIFRTLSEAAPSTPPQDIKVVNVTNNSITVSWIPPSKPNGVLRYYELSWNGNYTKVTLDSSQRTQVTLTHLESYTDYSIQIKACTRECSNASQPITARTLIGAPGPVNVLSFLYQNTSQVWLKWAAPDNPGGRIDYYMVTADIVQKNGVVYDSAQYTVTDTEFDVPVPACKIDGSFLLNFTVRAVNIDAENRHFMGVPMTQDIACIKTVEKSGNVVTWSVVGVLVAIIFLAVGVGYGRRFYRDCRETRELDVKLPVGMMPKDKKDPSFKDLTWGPHDRENDDSSGNARPPPDKERLLQEKDERERNESSGRSTGDDTVSSSTTSDTQVTGDSGNEFDQNEKAIPDSPKFPVACLPAYLHVGSPTFGRPVGVNPAGVNPAGGNPAGGNPANLEGVNWVPTRRGYVVMSSNDIPLGRQNHNVPPQRKPSGGYVAHNAPVVNPALWAKPTDGYVQTGTKPEHDLLEDEKGAVGGSEVKISASISGLREGTCKRTSAEVPLVPIRTLGYVPHQPLVEHNANPPVRYEYRMPGDEDLSSLMFDSVSRYSQVGENEPPNLVTGPENAPPNFVTAPEMAPPSSETAPEIAPPNLETAPEIAPCNLVTAHEMVPPNLVPAHEMAPPNLVPAHEMAPPNFVTAPEVAPPNFVTAPEIARAPEFVQAADLGKQTNLASGYVPHRQLD